MGNGVSAKGRGANVRPANRFATVQLDNELEYLEHDDDAQSELQAIRTKYYPDKSESIVSTNDSPDIHFSYSVNPYRGCAHGCSYCYARPTHEYLGLDAGLDFESKILVKLDAAKLLRDFLNRPQWQCEPIMFSGVTDSYQQAERHFQLTRQCLEVALEARQPVEIITKNSLVTRDLDLLSEMASMDLVRVAISITSNQQELIKRLEPRTSSPESRFRAIEKLASADVPTSVMVAPIIPGLN
ncbi:MAG: radical SAM protein, partial [Planctomycetales bacterium]|nr:radical SAM protein [Planctomycetales bacterium]